MYKIYILRTSKNTLYTGITNNLEKRLYQHENHTKKSAKYMRAFESFKLVYTEEAQSKSEALKKEAEIKRLTKKQKESLINSYDELGRIQ